MDLYEGFGSALVFDPSAGLIAVPAENYRVQFYSLFDDREISEVRVTGDAVCLDMLSNSVLNSIISSGSLPSFTMNWLMFCIAITICKGVG